MACLKQIKPILSSRGGWKTFATKIDMRCVDLIRQQRCQDRERKAKDFQDRFAGELREQLRLLFSGPILQFQMHPQKRG